MTTRSVYVRIRGDVSDLNRALIGGGRHVRDFTRELETGNDRATWLVQGVTAILPALAPLAVQGAPILAGLTAQLGFAAGAAGTAVAAFWGMGDAMKAINAYQADPTIANLEKVQETLDKLGPSGRDFVAQLDALMPRLRELKLAAEDGLLPGAGEGLEKAMEVLPRVRDIIDVLASASGQNLAELGENLADDRMVEFFDYLERNAGPITRDTGQALGLLAEGVGDLMIAFEPVSQAWSEGFVDMARTFRDWADGLDDSATFEQFLDYLEETGPQVLDTLKSLATTLLEVGEAAAPLGGPTLAVLRGFLDTVSAIADSPLGPTILGTASAVFALSRALAVTELLFRRNEGAAASTIDKVTGGYRDQVSAIKDLPAGFRDARAASRDLVASQREAQKVTGAYVGQLQASNQAQARGQQASVASLGRLNDSLSKVELANRDVATATDRAREAESRRNATLRQSAIGAGKSAAGAGALVLATSGVADGMGLANTATLGLMGTLAGPWGVAVGGAVGLVMDFAAAGQEMEDSLNALERQLDTNATAYEANRAAIAATREELRAMLADSTSFSLGDVVDPQAYKDAFAVFTGQQAQVEKNSDALDKLAESQRAVEETAYALGQSIDGESRVGLERFNEVVDATRPAMDALGISWQELADMSGEDRFAAFDDIGDFLAKADSAEGRIDALAGALTGLEDPLMSTANKAQALGTALGAVIGPGLEAEAATDGYTQSLSKLGDALRENGGGFDGNTAAALANRDASRAWAAGLTDMLTKQAAAGASAEDIARKVQQARTAFIDEARAAGLSEPAIRRRLRAMKLTPKLVRTIFEAAGLEQVSARVSRLNQRYQRLPRRIRTVIAADGVPKTAGDLDRLDRKVGGLTRRQRRIVARLMDETPATQRKILRNLKKVDDAKAKPTVSLIDKISSAVPRIQARINSLQGKSVTVTTVERTVKGNAAGDITLAGIVPSTAGDRANGHAPEITRSYRLFGEPETQGESYIPHANDWRRPRAKAIAAQTVAVLGGEVSWYAGGDILRGLDSSGSSYMSSVPQDLRGLMVAGTLDTPWGPAQINGMIRDRIDQALADRDDNAGMHERARLGSHRVRLP